MPAAFLAADLDGARTAELGGAGDHARGATGTRVGVRVADDPGPDRSEGRTRSVAVEIASVGALAFYLFTPTVPSFVCGRRPQHGADAGGDGLDRRRRGAARPRGRRPPAARG